MSSGSEKGLGGGGSKTTAWGASGSKSSGDQDLSRPRYDVSSSNDSRRSVKRCREDDNSSQGDALLSRYDVSSSEESRRSSKRGAFDNSGAWKHGLRVEAISPAARNVAPPSDSTHESPEEGRYVMLLDRRGTQPPRMSPSVGCYDVSSPETSTAMYHEAGGPVVEEASAHRISSQGKMRGGEAAVDKEASGKGDLAVRKRRNADGVVEGSKADFGGKRGEEGPKETLSAPVPAEVSCPFSLVQPTPSPREVDTVGSDSDYDYGPEHRLKPSRRQRRRQLPPSRRGSLVETGSADSGSESGPRWESESVDDTDSDGDQEGREDGGVEEVEERAVVFPADEQMMLPHHPRMAVPTSRDFEWCQVDITDPLGPHKSLLDRLAGRGSPLSMPGSSCPTPEAAPRSLLPSSLASSSWFAVDSRLRCWTPSASCPSLVAFVARAARYSWRGVESSRPRRLLLLMASHWRGLGSETPCQGFPGPGGRRMWGCVCGLPTRRRSSGGGICFPMIQERPSPRPVHV